MGFLLFIPFVNIVVLILHGAKGNEWAWKSRKWESLEKFNSAQNKWKPWGIAFFILNGSIALISLLKYFDLTV